MVRLISKNKGIKDYQNMLKEKLLSTFDKLKHIKKKLLRNGLNRKNAESFVK